MGDGGKKTSAGKPAAGDTISEQTAEHLREGLLTSDETTADDAPAVATSPEHTSDETTADDAPTLSRQIPSTPQTKPPRTTHPLSRQIHEHTADETTEDDRVAHAVEQADGAPKQAGDGHDDAGPSNEAESAPDADGSSDKPDESPTTKSPTTKSPTTKSPTTKSPTTKSPTRKTSRALTRTS